jgi:hypothetical protein
MRMEPGSALVNGGVSRVWLSSHIPTKPHIADFEQRGKHLTYLALGLLRRFHGKHWRLVIGVHSIPELDVPIDYRRR